MRNLSPLSIKQLQLALSTDKCSVQFDLDDGSLYFLSRTSEIQIFKIDASWDSTPTPLALATLETDSDVISFRYLAESRSICLILTNGDIATLSLDDVAIQFDIVGTVEPGVRAAAWSPDDALLSLVNGNDQLLQMTKDFEVLSEGPLRRTDFGEDQQVNVNWGSKATQFHGSLGKTAAVASTNQIPLGSSPDDDDQPRISWRGDGAYYVVSSLDPVGSTTEDLPIELRKRRVLRVYNRFAELQSTSEPLGGLEHVLSWRPSGNLIASTQRFGYPGGGVGKDGRHDLVLFERNGLRHGEFRLSDQPAKDGKYLHQVQELLWSCDSNILAVWLRKATGDVVQLWSTGNYHWYLKQELEIDGNRFSSVDWHPEDPLRLLIISETGQMRDYCFAREACNSSSDSGMVAVVDGGTILLTPFQLQNVPPPMSAGKLTSAGRRGPPTHITLASGADALALLWTSGSDSYSEIWSVHPGRGRQKTIKPLLIWSGLIAHLSDARQVVLWRGATGTGFQLAVLGSSHQQQDAVSIVYASEENPSTQVISSVPLPSQHGRLIPGDEALFGIAWQNAQGEIFRVVLNKELPAPIATFSIFCPTSQQISVRDGSSHTSLFFGLSPRGTLFASGEVSGPITLAANVTSFNAAGSFLTYTSTAHEATFAPLLSVWSLCSLPTRDSGIMQELIVNESSRWEKRRVERGSKIVTCIPIVMSLILQMPRGNLETIHPRALVMESVRQDVHAQQYRTAFLTCRKHRIDLNVIVDQDIDSFLSHIREFVDQVHEVDHINLFLSGLGQASQSPDKIAGICDAVRENLELKDLKKYVDSILTAHVVKSPPDYESALRVLLHLKANEPTLVEAAVKYIIFLADAERLFDTALGMYDFSLVLMVAQHSKRDPREYLPFLRELRALEENYQKFRIDEHLKRYSSALHHLHQAGPEHFQEALLFTEKHRLYKEALGRWKENSGERRAILDVYGEWLFERKEYKEAAIAFSQSDKKRRAMIAYEKCYSWRELFVIARELDLPNEEVAEIGYRVAETVASRRHHLEAAQILVDYCKDIPQAVGVLAHGNEVSEALRLISIHNQPHLVDSIVRPASLELVAQITEDIQEMREQLEKQAARWKELLAKKITEPDAFYGIEDAGLHNVDVMTDVSTPITTFTRYTAAPSHTSKASKMSSKNRRKLERKRDGRKGTVDEADYILASIVKLATRLAGTQGEASKLLSTLVALSSAEHSRAALELQQDLESFQAEYEKSVDLLWHEATLTTHPKATDGGDNADQGISLMERKGAPLPPKPELGGKQAWRLDCLTW